MEMRSGVVVEPEGSRERVEDLLGGMLVAPLLETHVVVAADAGQHRHFLAAQPAYAAATAGVWDADVLRLNQVTPGAQILADQVLMLHSTQRYALGRVDPGPATTRNTRPLVQLRAVTESRYMTSGTTRTLVQTAG